MLGIAVLARGVMVWTGTVQKRHAGSRFLGVRGPE